MAVGLKFKVLPFGDMADLAAAPSPLEINAPVNSTSSYTMLAITNNSDVTPNSIAVLFEPAAIQSLFNTGINLNAGSFTRGNSVQLPIFFYPTAAGRVNGELVLKAGGMTSTNQPYERTVRVPLIGNAGTSTIRLLGRKPTARDFESDDPRRPRPGRGAPQTSLRLNIGTIQPPVSNAVSFSILNLGQIDLEIPTMLGNFASSPPNQIFPIKIGPGEWTAVKLDLGIYHAPGIGAFTETVRILCNDPVTPEAHVIIDGAVGGAKGSIVPDFIDFSFVSVNSSVQRTTVFQNKGTVDFHVNKIVWQTGTFFRLAPPPTLPYLVPAGGSLTLDIEFGPVSVPGFYGDSFILGTSEGIFANLGVQAKAQ